MKKRMFAIPMVLLMAAVMLQSSASATSVESSINQNVFNTAEDSVSATLQSAQVLSMQNTDNLDIFSYTAMSKQQRQLAKLKNKYALADKDIAFGDTIHVTNDTNFWIKPYGDFEKVRTMEGTRTKNYGYGVFMGANSGIKELGKGWDYIWGGYMGYNGAYNSVEDLSMVQNGGTLGFENMFIKDNFFTGFDVNFGAGSSSFRHMDFHTTYLNGGVTNRTGYNFEFADGKFVIQPNLYTSYIFAQTFGHSKDVGNGDIVEVKSNAIHTIQLAPGINFIGNLKNGWQPYLGVSFIINFLPSSHFMPWYAAMPDMSTRPIIKYGAGVRKTWNERCSMMLQAFVRNGGRNGVGIQGGFSFALGK